LLDLFVPAVAEQKGPRDSRLLQLVPQLVGREEDTVYEKILRVTDYVSGMTDQFAIRMFRRLKGISLPHSLDRTRD
jgi:dGTPase